MKVEVELKETSQKLKYNAVNTYQKGSLYCIYDGKNVYKFPLNNIWRITEGYK